MPTSQNGYPASADRAAIGVAPLVVAGISFPGGVKTGPAATVLGWVALQVHRRVEALVDGWCWGYAYRDVRGSTGLSNHASGTAIDVNAPRHPLGQRGTFTARQVEEIHQILAEADRVVRWGGDYTGRPDEMHFEINAAPAAVERVAARLSNQEGELSARAEKLIADLHEVLYSGRTTSARYNRDLGHVVGQVRAAAAQGAARDAAILAAITALAPGAPVTAEQLTALVDAAVARHTPTAAQIAAAQLPHIEDAVHAALTEALDGDNDDLATDIVRRIGEHLTTTEGN